MIELEEQEFNSLIKDMDILVRKNNPTPNKWTFLTSINYMFSSKIYMQGVLADINAIEKHLREGSKILDIGTGVGYIAVILSQIGYLAEGIDTIQNKSIPKKDYERFKNQSKEQDLIWKEFKKKFKTKFQHYNGMKLPYKENSFDAIVAYAVIEHIANDEIDPVIYEIKRVLKPNGFLFVFKLPNKFSIAEYAGKISGIGGHDKLFRKIQISNFFRKYGFEIKDFEREDMTFSFPPNLTNKIYLLLNVVNKILIKTPLSIFSHHMNLILTNRK